MDKEKYLNFSAANRGRVSDEELEVIRVLGCSEVLADFLVMNTDFRGIVPSQISRVVAEYTHYYEDEGASDGVWVLALSDQRFCLARGWLDSDGLYVDDAGLDIQYADSVEKCLQLPISYDVDEEYREGLKRSLKKTNLGL